MIRTSLSIAALALLAACAGGSGAPERAAPAISGAPLALEEVSSRPLPAGRCSLILFSREAAAKRILVAFDTPGEAIVNIGGREQTLRRTAIAGDVLYGHAALSTYGAADGLAVSVAVSFEASPTREGAPTREATVTATRPSGESVVIPAVGVAACAPVER
jgi:hypothetical protein